MISGDLLYQVIKGSFKDHLVMWVGEYLSLEHGEACAKDLLDQIDRRYKIEVSALPHYTYYCHRIAAVPNFPGLRRFPQGRGFKQWTGDDLKALMKVKYRLLVLISLANLYSGLSPCYCRNSTIYYSPCINRLHGVLLHHVLGCH